MNSTDQSGDVSLADLIGETAGKQVNEKLDDLHCDPVRDGEEAKVAAAAYKEQDADGAADLVPLGFAGLALTVSASKTVGLLAIGVVLIIIYYVAAALMRRDKRSTSAARAVMDRRLATGRPLLSKGYARSVAGRTVTLRVSSTSSASPRSRRSVRNHEVTLGYTPT